MTREEAEGMYFIWNMQYESYWRPNKHGYTKCVLNAGLYTKAEAEAATSREEDRFLLVADEMKRMGDQYREDPESRESALGWVYGVLR